MIIPGGEIGSVVEAIRRAEHPLPEAMETEETELLPVQDRGRAAGLLQRLRRHAVESLHRVRQRLRSEKR